MIKSVETKFKVKISIEDEQRAPAAQSTNIAAGSKAEACWKVFAARRFIAPVSSLFIRLFECKRLHGTYGVNGDGATETELADTALAFDAGSCHHGRRAPGFRSFP